jgi:hypothetical protein
MAGDKQLVRFIISIGIPFKKPKAVTLKHIWVGGGKKNF